MAADPEFLPLDKTQCRHSLQLPLDAPLLGYIGSWSRNRGTDLLLRAFRRVRNVCPQVRLALSGRPPAHAIAEPGVIHTGYVADKNLPMLINALDVACIATANTRFGRYSYPAKLCEAMACGVPVVATATEPVRWMLHENSRHLAPLNDPAAFATRVLELLAQPTADYGQRRTWQDVAASLHQMLSDAQIQRR